MIYVYIYIYIYPCIHISIHTYLSIYLSTYPYIQVKINLPAPTKFRGKYALPESEVDPAQAPKIHGAKTANIVLSRRTLPAWIQTPRSAVVPFGVFEKVLSHPDNKQLAAEYHRLVDKELHSAADPLPVLGQLKECIKQLSAPKEMVDAVKQALVDSEIIEKGQLDGSEWDDAFMALKVRVIGFRV